MRHKKGLNVDFQAFFIATCFRWSKFEIAKFV